MANKNGIGGFKEHPENCYREGRPNAYETFAATYTYLLDKTFAELKAYKPRNMKEKMCVDVILKKKDYKEITNRIDGMPKQKIENENKHNFEQPVQINVIGAPVREDKPST